MFEFEIYFESRAHITVCFPISLVGLLVKRESRVISGFLA